MMAQELIRDAAKYFSIQTLENIMPGVLDGVDQRTKLIGKNRMELLLFQLNGKQKYGINVFKVREVLSCPEMTSLPKSNPVIHGLVTIRGKTLPVIDTGLAIRARPVASLDDCYMIVTEYNRSIQGFLVKSVDHIVNVKWDDIKSPPKATGKGSYMTAVTRINDELVEIIDVEKILAEIKGENTLLSSDIHAFQENTLQVMVVDDSSVARNQIKRTLEQLGISCIFAENGRQALDLLEDMATNSEQPVASQINLVISDIEMPVMDGYTLVSSIRNDERLKDLVILMHTSMSGSFNDSMIKKVGADRFIPKFQVDELALEVKSILDAQ